MLVGDNGDMSTNSETLVIHTDMIRLGQALKLANVVEDGVDARDLITAGDILVNGDIDLARELGITFRSLRYRLQKLGLESD